MLFWGLSFIWTKIVFKYYPPITTVTLRLVIAAIILLIAAKSMRVLTHIKKQDYLPFLLLGFFEPFCYFMGESFGLQVVPSTLASIIISTIPLFTPIVGFLMFRERMKWMNIAGILLSFAGILLMIINRDFSFNAPLQGIGFLFFAVFSALGYGVILKKLAHQYSPVTIILYQNLIGLILFFPFFLYFDFISFITTPLNYELISSLLLLAIFPSSLSFIFYTIVIREMGMCRANMFTYIVPVFTAFFSYLLLAESFGLYKIIGIGIVITGLYISQIKGKNSSPEIAPS